MRKFTVIAAAGVLATASTVGVVAAHGATPGTQHRPGVGTFTVVERAVSDTVADTGPSGDSVGDVLAFANPVYNAANTVQVGTDNGSCIRTKVAAAYQCSWTLTLRGGSLVVEGPFYDAADSVLAITGGTGIWAKARGQMSLHARNAAGTAYDFRYKVTR